MVHLLALLVQVGLVVALVRAARGAVRRDDHGDDPVAESDDPESVGPRPEDEPVRAEVGSDAG